MEMNNESDDIYSIAEKLSFIYDKAYTIYSKQCDELLLSKNVTAKQIERLLDGLLDFCGEERFVLLYKNVCRFLFPTFPETINDYVLLYKELYTDNGGLK